MSSSPFFFDFRVDLDNSEDETSQTQPEESREEELEFLADYSSTSEDSPPKKIIDLHEGYTETQQLDDEEVCHLTEEEPTFIAKALYNEVWRGTN